MRPEREPRTGEGSRPSPAVRDRDDDLSVLFGTSTALFASMAGPAHVLEAANPAFFTAIGGGQRARTGVPLGDLMPELEGQGFLRLLDQVYRTGSGTSAGTPASSSASAATPVRRTSTSPTRPAATPAATSSASA